MLDAATALSIRFAATLVMLMRLFDSHCHLDDPCLEADEALREMVQSSVDFAVIAGYGPGRHERGRYLCAGDNRLRRAVGLHPWWLGVGQVDVEQGWLQVREEASMPDVVAVGEIGLDRTRRRSVRCQEQRTHLRCGLDLANEVQLPVILHVVGWHGHALEELRANRPLCGGVVHRFNGADELIEPYVQLGLHLSVDVVSFSRHPVAARRRALAIPLHRLVVETDWPQPQTSYRQATAQLSQLIGEMAADRGLSPQGLADVLWENSVRLYRLDGHVGSPANAMSAK